MISRENPTLASFKSNPKLLHIIHAFNHPIPFDYRSKQMTLTWALMEKLSTPFTKQ